MTLRLVGCERLIGANEQALAAFYGVVFPRLAEVPDVGPLSRYVAYRSAAVGALEQRFLGIEVRAFGAIAAGMTAWELDEDALTRVGESRTPIDWTWRCESATCAGRWLGEFGEREPRRDYLLAANAYVGAGGTGGGVDDVRLVDYDPAWPREADETAAWLRGALGPDVALRVEHYGSTAIPGMPAKPIVDLLVEIPSFAEASRRVFVLFNDPVWEYWWYSDHMTFVRRSGIGGPRTHHIHMAPRSHAVWRGLAFRDHLRSHPREAARYAGLKRRLARAWRTDREGYTRAKTRYVERVTARASGEVRA